jgi:hypothetical protein
VEHFFGAHFDQKERKKFHSLAHFSFGVDGHVDQRKSRVNSREEWTAEGLDICRA